MSHSRDLFLAIGAGAVAAILDLFVPFAAPLPMFLAGLGLGLRPILIAGAAAAVTAILTGGFFSLVYDAVVLIGPTMLLCRKVLLARDDGKGGLEWYPPGLLAVWLTAIGAMIVVVAVIFASAASPGGAEAWVRDMLRGAIKGLGLFRNQAGLDTTVDILAPLAPGVAGAMWMIVMVINGSLAQNALVRARRNLRPATDLAMFQLPGWMPAAVVGAAAAAAAFGGDVGYAATNLVLVALVPYFLVGVAVIHVISRPWAARNVLLTLFYAFLFVFGWPASLLLMVLGLLEHWLNLRLRRSGGSS